MPPVVAIVGLSGSGKTTLMEKLIPRLTARGCRVATIKHAPEVVSVDRPGKDSWRHLQAGSEATVIAARDQLMLMVPVAGAGLDDALAVLGEDYDVAIAEGFKGANAPKIEVHRREAGPPLGAVDGLLAIATDEPLDIPVPQLALNDVDGLAGLIEQDIIRPGKERVAVRVNGEPIPLKLFPREIFAGVVTAMTSCLRGVRDIRTLSISVRRSGTGGR